MSFSFAAPLRVGIDLDGEPMTFVDHKGVPQGFAVEIMSAIAHEMNFEVVFVAKPWPEMFDDFTARRVDALANITYTEKRAQIIDFTDAHLVMNGAIFVRKDAPKLQSLVDLRSRRIAVKIGGAPHHYLEVHGWADHIVPSATLLDSLRAVAEGRADAALDARVIGLKNIRDEKLTSLEVADLPVVDFAQRQHIGLHLGSAAEVARINEGLARVRANGTYDRIYEKWIGALEPRRVRLRELRPYFLPAGLVVAFAIGVFLWQRRVLRRVGRQAEALRESEERLTMVMEASEDGFWDWDLHKQRVERSERWASMLGFTRDDIPPDPANGRDLVHPDDLPIYEAFRNRLHSGQGSRADVEYRMRTKSGEWRWILDRGKVVGRAADGTPTRIAGTHTDITDFRRARDEAARHEARFRFIYEHAPTGISWLERGQVASRLVNPAHERITGVPVARSRVPDSYVMATHPDDRPRQKELHERLYRGEIDHFSMEKRYVHADGSLVWALLTTYLFRDPVSGEVQEVTTLVDITERKHTEAEREKLQLKLLEAQKLESLGVLAGGIAHDFNNLLTVILANATLPRTDEPAHDRRIEHIKAAAQRAADLCRQMLAYAGKGNFLVERVDLGALVQDTAHLLNVSISKKAQLELALAPRLPTVDADASQIRQVVMNLVINASEALGTQSGEIRLATFLGRPEPAPRRIVHSFELPAGPCVCLEISDTGLGMDEATIARIFDPFFTTKFAGRGLGLAAVLGIVRAHHGALTVESAPGKGTTFRFYLPVSSQPVVRPPAIPTRTDAAIERGGTILIADDEPSVLATADAVLRDGGYQTVLAINGTDAVERFRKSPAGFSAVLLDLTMPGLDGAEVLRVLRAEHPGVRVLVMSGFSEVDVMNRLHGFSHVAVIRKPFTRESLLARVAEIVTPRPAASHEETAPHATNTMV